MTVLLCLLVTVPARSASAGSLPARTGILFGAAVGSRSGQSMEGAIEALETQLGRTLAVHRTYSRWDDAQPSTAALADVAHGRIPLVSIVPVRHDGTKLSWASIAAGTQDAAIAAQADGLRSLGSRVILIFQHEADVASGFGTAADFVAAYRHFVSVVRSRGAANVEFGVVFVGSTFGSSKAPMISAWYPGDDVVDWIGADLYNFGSCVPGVSGWRSLASAGAAFYSWGSQRGKPLMIAEWGSTESPTDASAKARWFGDVGSTLQQWSAVRLVSYFDTSGTCPDWWVDSSSASLAAFSQLANSPIAYGTASASTSGGVTATTSGAVASTPTSGATSAASPAPRLALLSALAVAH